MQAPERRSNSQPWSGHVTMSPSTAPSQRLPPVCAHSLPMARISSPRRNSATSRPFTTTSSTAPSGRAARSRTFTRGIVLLGSSVLQGGARGQRPWFAACAPSPCPLPLRGRGFRMLPLPSGERVGVRGGVPVRLVQNLREVQHLHPSPCGLEPLRDLDDAARILRHHRLGPRLADVRDLALLELPR